MTIFIEIIQAYVPSFPRDDEKWNKSEANMFIIDNNNNNCLGQSISFR